MRQLLLVWALSWLTMALHAQYVYTINADSVKITNHCDTAELIIENHTQNVPGFLFNKGRGRTEFRRVLQKVDPTTYLIGGDTLFTSPNAWMQGGNTFGATGILGTLDNNHLDIYTNNTQRARFTTAGNLLLGTTADNGYRLQLAGTGGISVDPNLSRSDDRIKYGGLLNADDGQNRLISMSHDGGQTYSPLMVERDGFIGLGNSGLPIGWWVGSPAIRMPDASYGGGVGVIAPAFYLGQDFVGPANVSRLVMTVSNTNEWNLGDNYPNGQNTYYFGTQLGSINPESGYKRAPLQVSGRTLQFLTGYPDVEAVRISEAGNLLVGTNNDEGYKLRVIGGHSYFNNGILFDDGGTPPNSVSRIFSGHTFFYQSNNHGDQHVFQNQIGVDFKGNLVTLDPGGYPGLLDSQLSLRVMGKNGTVGLNVNMAGYTGIGTNYPSAQLHTTGSVRFAGLTPDSSLIRVLVSDANGNLYYRNLSSWATSGIFNSDLAIKGVLSAQQVKLMPAGWADYVFDKTYHLPSLAEVENYIQKNRHLPGMPTAAEVSQKGIEVGESQAALLKKVEELTLYAIDQDKKLQAQDQLLKQQNKELEDIKQQINELKKLIGK